MYGVEMNTRLIPVGEILVAERIRTEHGDIPALAKSIQEHGLINPITVMEQANGGYILIAGLRRLEAVRSLGEHNIRATLLSPLEADEALMLEIAENEQRKEFTVSERLAYADRIKAVEVEKSKQRMLAGKRSEAADPVAKRPQGSGKTRDIVARKAGFTSEQQMRRAAEVAGKRPDLLGKIDNGELTIGGAISEMKRTEQPADLKEASNISSHETVVERLVDIEVYQPFKPHMMEAPGNVKTVKGADHDHLMENPIYNRLFISYNDAVRQVNLARGEMRTRCEGYERQIRGYKENIIAMQKELARLREVQHA